MSLQFSTIVDIQNWLKDKHITASTDWVEACVEFLQQEQGVSNLPLQRLKDLVYAQWLVSDLEEIASPNLPSNLCNALKTVLTGTFALQVNGIRDAGKPAYAQLKELEGSENSDATVSAAPKSFVPEWESKPTRMLILTLTDGVTILDGMEYKAIPHLSPNLPPGVKVLISGPIDCRFGMLQLTSESIQVLGGEVEKLQTLYSREEILRRCLNLPSKDEQSAGNSQTDAQPNFANSRSVFENGDSMASSTVSNLRLHPPTVSNVQQDMDDMDDFDDDFQNDFEAFDEIERISQAVITPETTTEVAESCSLLSSCESEVVKIKQEPSSPPHIDSREEKISYTSLSSIDHNADHEFSVTVKAYISNVVSRLECGSKGWHLTAKVTDGTTSIVADIHDKVLEKFVGISAKEVRVMKTQGRKNPEINQKIAQAVHGCKKKLEELNCTMEIKFTPGQNPCVVKCLNDK